MSAETLTRDLKVGRVELVAVEQALGDPGVDLVQALGQQLDVLAARLVGCAVHAGGEADDDRRGHAQHDAHRRRRGSAIMTLRNALRSRRAAQ